MFSTCSLTAKQSLLASKKLWSAVSMSRRSLITCFCAALLASQFATTSLAQTNAKSSDNISSSPASSSTTASTKKKSTSANTNTSSTTKNSKPAAKSSHTSKPKVATPVTSNALRSHVVYVQDLSNNNVLISRNEDGVRPIASITKLMTAIVIVDGKQSLNEIIEITQEDVDTIKHSRSRLAVGAKLTRGDMLHLALMSSENRAASALARYYPGGTTAFVLAMNIKARELGMNQSRFVEATGLSSSNVSTPRDLVKLMQAAMQRRSIQAFTTDDQQEVKTNNRSTTVFRNTNALVFRPDWDIKVSKTGFINEAGQCLVMVARINNRDTAIVLLDAEGKGTRVADAIRIKQMMQRQELASL